MWRLRKSEIQRGYCLAIEAEGARLSFRQVFDRLESDPAFARWYGDALARVDLQAFFWEHPPFTHGTFDSDAELVLVDAPGLAGLPPDPEPFRLQFEPRPNEDVLIFPNLGGDALLVVPRPLGDPVSYVHLASFVRSAPPRQQQSFWQQVARAVKKSVGSAPRWLSTAGMGVAWLHVRIDSRPKYYQHAPYRTPPSPRP